MRVLIAEEDAALGLFLQKGLKLEGHAVELLSDRQEGLRRMLEDPPDLLVLDLGLPEESGMRMLEQVGGAFSGTWILALLGRSGVEDRVTCLNLGADDCLVKPFSFSELTARCRALLRRRERIVETTLRAGGVELNRMRRSAKRDGISVELTAKEFALLEFLMQAQGRCCTRSELLRTVWHMSPDAGTNVVDVYVNYLRRKLGAARPLEAAGLDTLIETVRGEGYRIGSGPERKPVQSAGPVRFGVGDRQIA